MPSIEKALRLAEELHLASRVLLHTATRVKLQLEQARKRPTR